MFRIDEQNTEKLIIKKKKTRRKRTAKRML